jgi:hypothetical protein
MTSAEGNSSATLQRENAHLRQRVAELEQLLAARGEIILVNRGNKFNRIARTEALGKTDRELYPADIAAANWEIWQFINGDRMDFGAREDPGMRGHPRIPGV